MENSKVSDPAAASKQGAMEAPEDKGEDNAPSKIPGSQPADSGQAKAGSADAVATGKPEAAAAVATAVSAIDAIRRLPSGPGVEPEELITTQTQNFAAEAVAAAAVAGQNFTLEAPVGYVSESPGHGQVDNDVALTVSQSSATNKRLWSAEAITVSDREVQNLFAVKEGGTKLHPSQNSTPQPFVYDSSVPSRAQSRTSAGSQNNELVELMTKFVADNRDEMFRREQQAVEQAREKTRLEVELAILQTQLQYSNSGLVRDTAGSDFLSGTAATVFQGGSEEIPLFGLTHTAARNLYGRPIVSYSQRDATATMGEYRMSAQQAFGASGLDQGGERSAYQVDRVTSAGRPDSVGLRDAVSDVSNVSITRLIESIQGAHSTAAERPSVSVCVLPAVTDYISMPVYARLEPSLTKDGPFSPAVSKPLYSVAMPSVTEVDERIFHVSTQSGNMQNLDLPGVVCPPRTNTYQYGAQYGNWPVSIFPSQLSQASGIGLQFDIEPSVAGFLVRPKD